MKKNVRKEENAVLRNQRIAMTDEHDHDQCLKRNGGWRHFVLRNQDTRAI